MPTIECMHERMQPEHDYCPDCGETQTAESRVIRTLRARAERAEAALRELGKHPESCGDDCVSELARQDALAELAALRAELQKVRSAAISGMDAATQHGHSLVQQAARLKAESNPDALESERAANALLTEQLQKAEADLAALRAENEALQDDCSRLASYNAEESAHLRTRAEKAEAEREELRADSELLRRIVEAQFIDGLGDVDFHEEAAIAAAENGREEPNTRDYIAAWRIAMEAGR